MRTLYRRKQRTTCLEFSPDDYRLAVGGRLGPKAGRVDVWDLHGGDKPVTLAPLGAPPWDLAFTPGQGLVVALANRVVHCAGRGFRTVEVVREWGPDEYTRGVLSPAGDRLVLNTRGLVRLIDPRPPFAEVWSRPATAGPHTPGGAAFSPDGRWLALAGEYTVEVREAATGSWVRTFDRPAPTARWFGFQFSWSADGRWVCERWQQWVNVWDAATGRPVFQRVAQFNEWLNDAAFHPSSGRLGIAIADRTGGAVHLYDPGDWREAGAYTWPVGRVETLTFHPEGHLAAVGGDRPEVVVWDVD